MAPARPGVSSTERLLHRTRLRVFAVTLALLALLVVGVGAATTIVALRTLDGEVDRALATSVDTQVAQGEIPQDIGGSPQPGDGEEEEAEGRLPAAADTFLLGLDASGGLAGNPSSIALSGLPDPAAVAAAQASGRDLRTITAGGVTVRLLTVPLNEDGRLLGFVQGGFVLTLHDRQSRQLVLAILVIGAAGLIAAGLITLVVTGRALRPIRRTFENQRRFVADASHELRTPAALIRANAEILQREGLVRSDGEPLVADIVAEADRLGGLVGDLLQLAAWDETRLVLKPAALDLATLAASTVRGAGALAAQRGVELDVEAPAAVPVTGDRDRLVQLLLILVDNAVDHSPAGGIVTVRVRSEPGSAVIEVDDQGPGVPLEQREAIFEPFTRLAGTTRHGTGGTGLGLAIARRITDAHAGSITAGSPEGQGARFTVRLPAA